MVPTSFPSRFLRRLVRTRSQRSAPFVHPDQVPDAQLTLPRRIDDPATAAQVTRDLLRHHREAITLALYLDDQHRLVGTAVVAVGWVQQARSLCRFSWHQCHGTGATELRCPRSCVQPVRASPGGPRDRGRQRLLWLRASAPVLTRRFVPGRTHPSRII